MPKIKYREHRFSRTSRALICKANEIISEYQGQGYDLTLRQLYYQFVSRALIANTSKEYKQLGAVVSNARVAGLIDWYAITDRTRNLMALSHWSGPSEIIKSCAASFRVDLWVGQDTRVEVWIEKEALAGVFQRVCEVHDVPFFSCRGYTSQSEMWVAAQRLIDIERDGTKTIILHFGDHDPSGIDMTRDIADRLKLFGSSVTVERLALNMDQVAKYNPPPNPTKMTDARSSDYCDKFGDECWELDALEPAVLAELVEARLRGIIDHDAMQKRIALIEHGKLTLRKLSSHFSKVRTFVEKL